MTHHSYRYSYRNFRESDLDWLELLDDECELVRQHVETLKQLAIKSGMRKTCGIAMYDKQPLFIGSYCQIAPGVAEVFIIPGKRALQYPRAFVRSVILWRQWLEKRPWCNRIQTLSLPTSLIDRWMEAMGFVCEDTLNSYTEAGQAYRLWSREKVDGVWGHR